MQFPNSAIISLMENIFNLITTLGAGIIFVFSIYFLISTWSKKTKKTIFTKFLIKKANLLIFLASFVAVFGSLIYSELFGFEPCTLCWWQRIFIYPIMFISFVALIKKENSAFQYINPLAFIALLFSLYHNYILISASESYICNPDTFGSCSTRFVEVFAFIDIPFMALSIVLFILSISFVANRK